MHGDSPQPAARPNSAPDDRSTATEIGYLRAFLRQGEQYVLDLPADMLRSPDFGRVPHSPFAD